MDNSVSNEYIMKYCCTNCGSVLTAAIEKGIPAPRVITDLPCKVCGCGPLQIIIPTNSENLMEARFQK